MKRLRTSRWSEQLLSARTGAAALRSSRPSIITATPLRRHLSTAAAAESSLDQQDPTDIIHNTHRPLPSPRPSAAAKSAKLAALHARLALSKKIPLETLGRALVTATADQNQLFNNSHLANVGRTIINYHVLEHLLCKFPRLPTAVLYEAVRAYAGSAALYTVARRWGVDAAAAPGEEVDPGLLQWKPDADVAGVAAGGYIRSEDKDRLTLSPWRRGMSSRVVLDDDFGDKAGQDSALVFPRTASSDVDKYNNLQSKAYGSFAQAVVGSIYAHCGRDAAKDFVKSHILSRHFDLTRMFEFKAPTRELTMLCAREGFDAPIARLESETGRLSRHPVFVVGIYSGAQKLGEAAGPSLDMARRMASMAALRAWYLYSPGNKPRVPSDMLDQGAKPWKAPYIDIGEIV